MLKTADKKQMDSIGGVVCWMITGETRPRCWRKSVKKASFILKNQPYPSSWLCFIQIQKIQDMQTKMGFGEPVF